MMSTCVNKIKIIEKLKVLIFLFSINVCYSQIKDEYLLSDIHGKLTNGLEYFVKKNNTNDPETLFYFLIKTGSLNESANQRGYAHFLEHIAFKGGKRFKNKTFINLLKEQGLQIGKNFNAITSYDYTLYKVKLPKKASLDTQRMIFKFFADILDGLFLREKDIEVEKKIILAEKKANYKKDNLFLFKVGNSLYRKRNPIGTDLSILEVTSKKLLKFYKKHYKPEKSAVIVVGDITPSKTLELITSNFKNIKSSKSKQYVKTNFYNQLSNQFVIHTKKEDSIKKLQVLLAEKRSLKSTKEKIISNIVKRVLNNRLDSILGGTTNLSIRTNHFLGDVNYTNISCNVSTNATKILEKIFTEIKRISDFGLTTSEIEYQVKIEQKKHRQKITRYTNQYIVSKLISRLLQKQKKNDTYKSVKVSDITNNEIKKRAYELFNNTKKRIYLTLPLSEKKENIKKIHLKKKLLAINKKRLTPFLFKSPKKKDKIVKSYTLKISKLKENKPIAKKYYPSLNITKLNYSNGIEVILKPLKNSEKEIKIIGIAKGGTSYLHDSIYYKYESTIPYMELGGVGNLNYKQFQNYLSDKNMGLSLMMSEYQRFISGYTEKKYLKEFFKYLYLKMTASRKNKKEFNAVISSEIIALQNNYKKSFYSKAELKIIELLGQYFPKRAGASSVEQFKKLNLSEMNLWYDKAFKFANNWKFIIVGNYKIDEIIPLVNRSISNLKKTNTSIQNKDLFIVKNHSRTHLFKQNKINTNTSYTLIFYSKYNPSLKSSLLVSLFEAMVRDIITNLLREKLGFVYTPIVEIERNISHKPFVTLKIAWQCQSQYAEQSKKVVIQKIKALATQKIVIHNFANYKKQLLLQYKKITSSVNPHTWASSLQKTIENGESIDQEVNFEKILKAITYKDLMDYSSKNLNINTIEIVKVQPK